MFKELARVASVLSLGVAITLCLSIPGPAEGFEGDCVYDPGGGEDPPSCCYCKEVENPNQDYVCVEGFGSWAMKVLREGGYQETAYCSNDVCPEEECPNGGNCSSWLIRVGNGREVSRGGGASLTTTSPCGLPLGQDGLVRFGFVSRG